MQVRSKKWSIDLRDLGKGMLMAAIAAGLGSLIEILNDGTINMSTLKTAGLSALIGGVSYLLKNLSTNSDGQVLGKERRA